MRALVKSAPAPGLDLREVAEPDPGPGEVVIAVGAAAVCGSDVARYEWAEPYWSGNAKDMTRDLPRVLGHEFAGTVVGLGLGVNEDLDGQRVAVRNILGCGNCVNCCQGSENACHSRRTIGVHIDGGYAERVVVPARNCTPIGGSINFHLAASLQPFAVATHAIARFGPVPGDAIAVWGLGPIGVACCLAARLRGVEVAAAFDTNEERVEAARAIGITALVSDAQGAAAQSLADSVAVRSLDALVDCAGVPTELFASRAALRKRGAMVLVGNVRRTVEVDLLPLIMDEQRLLGSRSYSNASWDIAVRTLGRSGFQASLGDEVGLDEALERFALAAAGRGRPFTIVPSD